MKTLIAGLLLPLALQACRTQRPPMPTLKSSQPAVPGETPRPETDDTTEGFPVFVDSNDPLDTYLSVGPYLQKEFDTGTSAGKTVKVYMQVRQENSVATNFTDLKTSMGKLHASVIPALESAQKKGITTVEFEAEVAALKGTVAKINKAASGIEVSLPTVK